MKLKLVSAEQVSFEVEHGWITIGEVYDVVKFDDGSYYILDNDGDPLTILNSELSDFILLESAQDEPQNDFTTEEDK